MKDANEPFEYDDINIYKLIQETDPKLWEALCLLTQSVFERRCKSKVTDHLSISYHSKKMRHFFLLCTLLFCTDDRCSQPLHTLVADIVDSQGGSTLLIKITNRLGVCASLSRFVQYKSSTVSADQVKYLKPESYTVVSADNIDFLHSYARVFQGNQTSSWHETSIHVAQSYPHFHYLKLT